MADEQWGDDGMIDFSQSPTDASSFEQGRAPCRGKGRGTIFCNNDSNSDVGRNTYGNDRSDRQKSYDETNNGSYNDSEFGGNNERKSNDRPRYRNSSGNDDTSNRRWQGQGNRNNNTYGNNRRNQNNDNTTEDNEYDGNYRNDKRDGSKRNRNDNRNEKGSYNRNRGNNGDDDYNSNSYGNDNDGNRRQRRNDSGDGGFSEQNNDNDQPKNREIYIPPEINDENSLFANDVTMGINFDKYDDIDVKVSGENVPQPIQSFDEAGLRTLLVENIKKSGYKKPTPVQKYAIPIIMNGRDLMSCAQTGSGKTAAFVVPIIHTLLESPKDLIKNGSACEPQVVIISPTRELTIQIYQQVLKFSLTSILRTEIVYGGTSVMHQGNRVSAGCHILVATPGRLLDFLGKGRIKLSSVRFFVFDEADRMLDMGFLPDVEKIIDHETMVSPQERQTLMFSATFPSEIQQLASRFLNNYLFLAVGIVGGACSDVEQNFYQASGPPEKRRLLKELIEKQSQVGSIEGTLVFVEQKRYTDFIAAFLSENNFPTTSIHGDRLQREREEALSDFKRGKMSILVATAVAARGLDIKNVSHVINYDMPRSIDEYVHRIGRTGRVGNRGKATSFFDHDHDMGLVGDLVKILKQAEQPVPDWLESGGGGGSRTFGPGRGRFGGEDIRRNKDGYGETYEDSAPSASAEPDEVW